MLPVERLGKKFNWRHEQTKLEGVVEKVLQ